MPIIQRPDLVAKIRKKYELTGPDAISTISPEVVPVVLLEDLSREDPGIAVKYCWGFSISGATTNTAHVELYNPPGSGVDLVIRRAESYCSANSALFLCYFSTALANGSGLVLNRNMGQSGTPAAQTLWEDNVAPLGAAIAQYYYTAGGGPIHNVSSFRVPPGEGMGWRPNLTTVLIYGRWEWEEVPHV